MNSTRKTPTDPRSLIEQVQAKMRKLADEFASGEINTEQFYRIYEHYQARINMASALLEESELAAQPGDNQETIAIRRSYTGMAKGAAVFLYGQQDVLETIGDFQFPTGDALGIVQAYARRAPKGEALDAQIRQHGDDWVLFSPGKYSVVVMLFSNEPVARQMAMVQNMLHDFETANEAALASGETQAAVLVFPFITFIRRSVGRKPETS
jgi:hypothetical protein